MRRLILGVTLLLLAALTIGVIVGLDEAARAGLLHRFVPGRLDQRPRSSTHLIPGGHRHSSGKHGSGPQRQT